jgi:hypothetical protein
MTAKTACKAPSGDRWTGCAGQLAPPERSRSEQAPHFKCGRMGPIMHPSMGLEGLDRIEWGALTHAEGSAGDVPELLRRVAFPAEAVRLESLQGLWRKLGGGGVVWEATPKAIPFLVAILRMPRVGNQAG